MVADCHHFYEQQMVINFHTISHFCLNVFNVFSSDNVMQGVTVMMHSTSRVGIPGEGLKFLTTPEEMSAGRLQSR